MSYLIRQPYFKENIMEGNSNSFKRYGHTMTRSGINDEFKFQVYVSIRGNSQIIKSMVQTQHVKRALLPWGTGALESDWHVANFLCFEIKAEEEYASPGWSFSNVCDTTSSLQMLNWPGIAPHKAHATHGIASLAPKPGRDLSTW